MTTEISIKTIGDAVRERVKKAIFDSIPDEAIESLIQKELNILTEKTSYQNKSPLSEMVATALKEELSNRVKTDAKIYIEDTYVNNSKELVDAAIKELAPVFMASMMEKFAAMAIQDLRYQLNNKGIYL